MNLKGKLKYDFSEHEIEFDGDNIIIDNEQMETLFDEEFIEELEMYHKNYDMIVERYYNEIKKGLACELRRKDKIKDSDPICLVGEELESMCRKICGDEVFEELMKEKSDN